MISIVHSSMHQPHQSGKVQCPVQKSLHRKPHTRNIKGLETISRQNDWVFASTTNTFSACVLPHTPMHLKMIARVQTSQNSLTLLADPTRTHQNSLAFCVTFIHTYSQPLRLTSTHMHSTKVIDIHTLRQLKLTPFVTRLCLWNECGTHKSRCIYHWVCQPKLNN